VSVIRIAAAVIVGADGRILLVRKRGTRAFMLAGGKIDAGETALEALRREIDEELGCGVAGDARPLGRFSAPAAFEPGQIVEAELFAVALDGEIRLAAEIEEVAWHDPADLESRPLAALARTHALPLAQALWYRESAAENAP
jgi:8-oxo-dGTP pyrophosphatase MutT (NUDIX family)